MSVVNRRNIGKQSEPGGGLRRGKRGRSTPPPFPLPRLPLYLSFSPNAEPCPRLLYPLPRGDDNGQAGSQTVLCIAIEVGLVLTVCASFCLVSFALPGFSNINQFLSCRHH